MLSQLSLRFRIFLFFALLALGGATATGLALWFGYTRLDPEAPLSSFIAAEVIATLGIVGLTAGVWLLFDENVAKPIERLAADMRVRAHTDVEDAVDHAPAKYLGDLAPAASAVTQNLTKTRSEVEEALQKQTETLEAERARLRALLAELPTPVFLCTPDHRLVFYNAAAVDCLPGHEAPSLDASLLTFFEEDSINEAFKKTQWTEHDAGVPLTLTLKNGDTLTAHMRLIQALTTQCYLLALPHCTTRPAHLSAPLPVYDFNLTDRSNETLQRRAHVVFDTETTGLLPHKDEVVQIGARRIVNARMIEAERFDTLVRPGMPIPSASTKIHHITDEMVADAPNMATAGKRFHSFCKDAVLVAHNAPFDMAFMHKHSKAMGVTFDHTVLDTVLLSALVFGESAEHTLDALTDRLSVTIPDALRHTALGDATATAQVYCRLLPLLEARGITTVAHVSEAVKPIRGLVEDLNN
ncbi:MAG: exonuclease domain-containing protein [Pseudomonadota bacterium]